MGRNSIPKLSEWRDGKLYRFYWMDSHPPYGGRERTADNGQMIVYEVTTGSGRPDVPNKSEVLAAVFADGLEEVMAAMYSAGFQKGRAAGRKAAKEEIRRALEGD